MTPPRECWVVRQMDRFAPETQIAIGYALIGLGQLVMWGSILCMVVRP